MSQRTRLVTLATLLFAAVPALAQPTPDAPTPPTDPTPPAPPTPPTPPTPAVVVVTPPPAAPVEVKPASPSILAKFDTTLYGFVELDTIYDTTQGLNDLAGNASIPRPNTYTGDHGQTMMGARNSRIGFKLAAPTYNDIKVSGQLEMDFLGNQPPSVTINNNTVAGISEAAFWQNPTFRLRHFNLKMETPAVDILIGQYWQLFGWQSLFHANTVEIQGVPGQIYSRAPQIRISKKVTSGDVTFELAAAAARPPQRASGTPDGQVGFKVTFDKIKALHTAGSTGTGVDGLSIGVSAVGRRFAVPGILDPSSQVTRNGYGLSIDALIPLITATKDQRANALTVTGSYVTGAGIADLYTGLNGGVSQPAPPNPNMLNPAPQYPINVDNGLVQFIADGTLHPVQWTSYIAGVQYYLPPSGKVWISANYSHMSSPNADNFGNHAKIWNDSTWADGNLFVDVTPALRFGLEFAYFDQTYVDGQDAHDYRSQLSAFLLF